MNRDRNRSLAEEGAQGAAADAAGAATESSYDEEVLSVFSHVLRNSIPCARFSNLGKTYCQRRYQILP